MHSIRRILIFLTVLAAFFKNSFAQEQDKEQSKLYMEQADLILAETKAMDDARDLMVMAADMDTSNIKANFQAGHMHIETIGKDRASKYFLRIYRQDPDYRFDLEYWIGKSFQYGLEFDKALDYYGRYKAKLQKKPNYQGKDKVDMKEVDRRLEECQNGKEFVASPKNFSIINVGREINSEFDDFGPVLSENEDEIYFTTRRRDGNLNENVAIDNVPFEDIFFSTKAGGAWKRAANIGPLVNQKTNDSNLALSADGKTLFVYNDEGNGDIYFSARGTDGAWTAPEPLPGIINSTFRESSVSVTKDGNTLYFASERPGGLGGSDIYVCTKDSKGQWSKVKNLGPKINTDQDEDGPFIDYDQKTLYFSSKGRKGMGGYDIFKATLVNPEKNEWSDPENLGFPINTPDDDVFFVSTKDGKRGYYASVRDDGMGYLDIYEITIPEEKKEEPKEEPIAKEEPKKEEPKVEAKEEPKEEPKKEPQPYVYVVKVIDAVSKAPLDAKVKLAGAKDNVVAGVSAKGNGVYEFSITSSTKKDYKLSAELEGYIFQNLTVSLAGTATQNGAVEKIIELRKLVVGARSVLRNIYFDFDKATFKQESYSELNKLETMMKQNGGLQVEISGHTDIVGSRDYNKKLSQRRADAVKNFLTSKGVDARRIKAVGYGEEKPLASNDDDKEGRELNRRVEFKVLGN